MLIQNDIFWQRYIERFELFLKKYFDSNSINSNAFETEGIKEYKTFIVTPINLDRNECTVCFSLSSGTKKGFSDRFTHWIEYEILEEKEWCCDGFIGFTENREDFEQRFNDFEQLFFKAIDFESL